MSGAGFHNQLHNQLHSPRHIDNNSDLIKNIWFYLILTGCHEYLYICVCVYDITGLSVVPVEWQSVCCTRQRHVFLCWRACILIGLICSTIGRCRFIKKLKNRPINRSTSSHIFMTENEKYYLSIIIIKIKYFQTLMKMSSIVEITLCCSTLIWRRTVCCFCFISGHWKFTLE